MVEVRPSSPRDEEALAVLDRAAWTPFSSPGPLEEAEPFFNERTSPDDVLVAIEDGEVAGYVRLGRASRFSSSDHVLTVNGIAVDPGRQGRGVGRALIDAAIAEARRRGARRLTLRVFSPNEPARRLYESAGFVVEGVLREEFFLDGAYVDDIQMAIDLTAALS
ncbi:MAG TPA: GNAT family N-acetyltransferase [Gaiellaceae bacterium]|nr:GNAT family N-acetyltransferase [Gaiellaceae bacterium]